MEISLYRQFYAEEVAAVCGLQSPTLVSALARIERERFLPPGPWMVRGPNDLAPRATPDADPRRTCHDYSIAIDVSRQLFNGAPGVVAKSIEVLDLQPGDQVLHVGAGLGYYTAILAELTGKSGRVLAYEVDERLAVAARSNLRPWPHVDLRHGDSANIPSQEAFDAVLVSAGMTHPLASWLDGTNVGGRLVVPLTVSLSGMGPLGKGMTVLLTKRVSGDFDVRSLGLTAIYSAAAIRDGSLEERLGQAMQRMPYPRFTALARSAHAPGSKCWLHGDGFCIGQE